MKSRFIVFVVLAVFLSACTLAEDITPPPNYQSPTPAPTAGPLFPQNPPNPASAAAIYVEKCAPCHGEKGLGDGPMAAQLQKVPAAIGKPEISRAASPANWYTTVTQGNINSFMPPFNGSLSDQQRWDVVAYAISLGGSTSAEVDKGKAIYEAKCSTLCHGPGGNALPKSDFTNQTIMAKLTQNDIVNFINKGIDKMPAMNGQLADADAYAVAAYVRSFSQVSAQLAASVPTATPQAPTATAAPLEPTITPGGTPAATSAADLTGTPAGTLAAETTPAAGATASTGTPAAETTLAAGATAASTGTPAAETTSAASATASTGTPAEVFGSFTGKVANGSGGTVPSGLKAVLHIFEHNTTTQQFSEVATQEAPLSADAAYSFDKVSIPANRAFYVAVNYADTNYESDPAFPKDGVTSFDLPVTIYDTTRDPSGLVADQAHFLLDYSKPDVVQVVEFFIISNPGTKTVIAAEKGGPVVSVSLPQGYANLQFEQGAIGDRYLKTDNGFADTTSIAPHMKQYQIVFAIDLPLPKPGIFGGQKLQFSQLFPVTAKSVSILVPEGVTVEGANITAGGSQDMGNGAKYQVFNAGAVDIGKSLEISAIGAAKGTTGIATTSTGSTQSVIIGIGAFGFVLIIAGGWLFWRDRQRSDDEAAEDDLDEEDGDGGKDGSNQDEIVDAIVALEDQFKAGNISEVVYKERRAELKDKLKGLL